MTAGVELKEKTLSEHAAYELFKAGLTDNEDPEARQTAINIMALVRRYEKQNHTDKSGPFVLEMFGTLCQRLPISPLTDDPDEWEKFEIDRKNVDSGEIEKRVIWQSRRQPSVFSEDQGKTWVDQRTGKVGESQNHEEAEAEREAIRKSRKERSEGSKPQATSDKPVGHVDPTVPAAEAPVESPAPAAPADAPKSKSKSQQRREAVSKKDASKKAK